VSERIEDLVQLKQEIEAILEDFKKRLKELGE
jgi:predicted component of type VI protein secretion system